MVSGLIIIVIIVIVIVGGSSPKATTRGVRPLLVIPGPKGIVGGTTPNASDRSWVLVNIHGKANLQLINAKTGALGGIIPLSKEARTVAVATGGNVGVGLSSGRSGAIEFFSAVGFAKIGVVALPGPVKDLVAGSNGTSFYALVDLRGNDSVDVISVKTFRIAGTIPLPSKTVSIAVSPDLATIYALQEDGKISLANGQTGQVTQSFRSAAGGRQIALSIDGSTLYVLKGGIINDNVAIINVATESTVAVLPAPAQCQRIAPSLDGTQLLDFVGSATYGNIQIFATNR
jgi:DNA-binding beta-propeller fold protein YncE